MAKILIEISQHWHEEETECQECVLCEMVIYSNVYRMCFRINERIEETSIILCNSCYNAVLKQD